MSYKTDYHFFKNLNMKTKSNVIGLETGNTRMGWISKKNVMKMIQKLHFFALVECYYFPKHQQEHSNFLCAL